MACNWVNEAYFADLMCATDKRAHTALELLVDDLHTDKEKTITYFLSHSGSEDFLWGLVRLLGSDNPRVAGNSAYIIGTLAESELGCYRIMALAKGHHGENRHVLSDLTRMLTFDDAESVMNAAGTMGTLAESGEGRRWMLSEACVDEMLLHVTMLLKSDNLWTASNAALVLARLCISEDGCNAILSHPRTQFILSQLVQALGVDEAGRGMNAAFAIGRLCDMDAGRQRLLALHDSEKMISSLSKMLSCEDAGASKNACFALSCLATNMEGHSRLLQNVHSEDVLKTLARLLNAEDSETGWFAAMTLRTLASQPKGCLRLRENSQVISALKQLIELQSDMNPDLKEEVINTLEILKRLDKPAAFKAEVKGADRVAVQWEPVVTKSGFTVSYQLYEGNRCVYDGTNCSLELDRLEASRSYTYKVRAYTEGDTTGFTDPVMVTTEEDTPGPPANLQVLGCTISQLKIGWEPPEHPNGVVKGYYVYQGRSMVEHTTDTMAIITGLTANTTYEIQVCAATSKGKGEKATVSGSTAELGAHAPSKPHLQVIGRNEIHVTWDPPEVPLGRITRYDLSMNGRVVYSGTDLSFSALRLTPDTEYVFVVMALTNEGKFESKSAKKRTPKNEYDVSRPPLYPQPQPRKEVEEDVKQISSKKRKSVSDSHKPSLIGSGKGHRRNSEPDRPKSAVSSTGSVQETGAQESIVEVSKSSTLPPSFRPQKAKTTLKGSHLNSRRDNPRPQTHKENSSHTSLLPAASKDSPTHRSVRSERMSQIKSSFPVTVSYVSIQGGDDAQLSMNVFSTEFVQNKKALIRSNTLLDPPAHTGLRFDRSKTSFLGPKLAARPKLSRLEADISLSGTVSPSVGSFPQNGVGLIHEQGFGLVGPTVGSGSDSGHGHTTLSKPAMPSHAYLEGMRGLSASSEHSFHSVHQNLLPCSDDFSSLDAPFDPSTLNSLKKGPSCTVDIHTSTPELSSYFIEAQQAFEQRARTFMRSHRPSSFRQAKVQHANVPIQLVGGGTLVTATKAGSNPHQNQLMQNKFVPMQLRTQPANLTPGQLQRMNTSLLEPRGVPLRRLESLPRSHTQINIKTQSSRQVKRPSFGSSDLIGHTLPASQT